MVEQLEMHEIMLAKATELEKRVYAATLPTPILIDTPHGLTPLCHDTVYGLLVHVGRDIGRFKYKNTKDMYSYEEEEERRQLEPVSFSTRVPDVMFALDALHDGHGGGWGISYTTEVGTKLLIYGYGISIDGQRVTTQEFHRATFETVHNQLLVHTRYFETIDATVLLGDEAFQAMQQRMPAGRFEDIMGELKRGYAVFGTKMVYHDHDARDDMRKMTEGMLEGLAKEVFLV